MASFFGFFFFLKQCVIYSKLALNYIAVRDLNFQILFSSLHITGEQHPELGLWSAGGKKTTRIFKDKISLCRPGWLRTLCVDQVGLKLAVIPLHLGLLNAEINGVCHCSILKYLFEFWFFVSMTLPHQTIAFGLKYVCMVHKTLYTVI